jgi:hypothetical protein
MIVVGYWIIPLIITIILLCIMFRPNPEKDGWFGDLFILFRLFWTIPILIVWIIYLLFR